jgi:lipopolysaccharide export system protein LptA
MLPPHNKNAMAVFWLWLVFSGAVFAATPDSTLPITIEADRAELDEKKGLSTYSGHVILSQGGITITADQLIVESQNGQLRHVKALGQPVQYTQKDQPDQAGVNGEAQTMEYHAAEERLTLIGNAKLSQGPNSFSGNRIEYDTRDERVTATVSETGEERVHVTIQPQTLKRPPSTPVRDEANTNP